MMRSKTSLASEYVIRAEALVRIYRVGSQEVPALQGVDLAVARGQVIALRGRSGSGKTTLLNCLSGLDRPTSGRVWLEGRDMNQMSEQEMVQLRRCRIGFVFQSHTLLTTYSACENIELMLRLAGVTDRRERWRRVQYALAMVGMQKWADHRPYELSGGQQQRIAIARAFVVEPALILADEPTGDLDSTTGFQILELFRQIADRKMTTVLIATHNLTVDMFADQVYSLEDGRIKIQAKLAEG